MFLNFKWSSEVLWSLTKQPICFPRRRSRSSSSITAVFLSSPTSQVRSGVTERCHCFLLTSVPRCNTNAFTCWRCVGRRVDCCRCAGDWAFSLNGSSLTPRWPSTYVLIWIHANTCCRSHASRRGRADANSSPGMQVFYTLTNTPQLCFNFMVSTRIYIHMHLATLQCKCCHTVAVFIVLVGWRI